MSPDQPWALLAQFTAKPGQALKVRAMLDDYARLVRAEPGNRIFAHHQVDAHPEAFIVYEVYADRTAFDTHLAAPYGAAFNARLSPLIEEPQARLTFLTAPD